jgi:hypothetical protein
MDARDVVTADALFEAALGVPLVLGALTGALGADDFPDPVGSAVVAVAGCLLLGIAAFLWRGGVALRTLAAANAVTAAAGLVWFVAADDFSAAGTLVVVVAVVGLTLLAAAQIAASADRVSLR